MHLTAVVLQAALGGRGHTSMNTFLWATVVVLAWPGTNHRPLVLSATQHQLSEDGAQWGGSKCVRQPALSCVREQAWE